MIARGSSVALGSGWLSGIAASTPVTAARMTERAAAPFAHERKDRRHRGIPSQFRFDEVDAAREGALAEEQHPIGLAHRVNRIARKLPPLHSNHVQSRQLPDRPDDEPERNDVGTHSGQPGDHGMGADAAELMHGREPADEDVIPDDAMAAQGGAVGEHYLAADAAIMTDVAVGHVEPAFADLGADVHGHALADVALAADDEPRRPAAVTDRLRRRAERGEGVDRRSSTQGGMAGDVDVRQQPASRSDRDVRADDAIGPDVDVFGDLRGALDASRWVNARQPAVTARRSSRRARLRTRSDHPLWPRRETTTCSGAWRGGACGTRRDCPESRAGG